MTNFTIYDALPATSGSAAPLNDAATPTEMRVEIFRLQHYDSLVRAVMRLADYNRMSAEDRYIVLAYHALRARSDVQAQLLEFVRTNISSRIPVKNPVLDSQEEV